MPSLPTPGSIARAAQAQTEALMALPGVLLALTAQVRGLTEALASLQRVTARIEAIVDEIEPGIVRLGRALDDPVVDEIPATIREFQENVLPVAKQLHETQSRIATIADATARLSSFPASALFGRKPRIVDEDDEVGPEE